MLLVQYQTLIRLSTSLSAKVLPSGEKAAVTQAAGEYHRHTARSVFASGCFASSTLTRERWTKDLSTYLISDKPQQAHPVSLLRFVTNQVDGLMRVQLDTGIPVLSVVLTPQSFHEHADHLHFFSEHLIKKGQEAVRACRHVLTQQRAAA